MGVYIPGMEMPKDCLKCPFCLFADGYWKCFVDGGHADFGGTCRPSLCPLVPAADVRPVKRGKWMPKNEIGDCCYQCSDCGFVRDAYILDIGNYCPNCGAYMREQPREEA